jgi:hypothetical protein
MQFASQPGDRSMHDIRSFDSSWGVRHKTHRSLALLLLTCERGAGWGDWRSADLCSVNTPRSDAKIDAQLVCIVDNAPAIPDDTFRFFIQSTGCACAPAPGWERCRRWRSSAAP